MDTNINNYSVDDILTIFNLKKNTITISQINEVSHKLINRMKNENKPDLATFFKQAGDKLTAYAYANANPYVDTDEDADANADEDPDAGTDADTDIDDDDNEYENAYKKEITPLYPPQTGDVNETNKYTKRGQQVKVADETSHFVMNQERLGIIESKPISITQGTLNPNLTNTIKRMVSIDSQYRQNILPFSRNDPNLPSYNTDYTLDLTDPLSNVLSIKLNSIQIPTSWYTFDTIIGNTCFEISGTIIEISSGNYTASQLVTELNTKLSSPIDYQIDISYNSNTGKIDFSNNTIFPQTITFYKNGGINLCSLTNGGNCNKAGQKINQNLGWNLGFRKEPDASGNITIIIPPNQKKVAEAVIDVYGPKYFFLVLDDYNNNHLNQGLINITTTLNKVNVPSYYNSSINEQAECENVEVNLNNMETRSIPMVKKSYPRKFTQAQLYAANEIVANRKASLNNRTTGPTASDIFAIIPLVNITRQIRPDPYILIGPPLQEAQRTYFGPVNIERLRVRLLDDKGNLVNLNDNDWSFSMIVEQLYQY
jgi:hypothetical protein